MTTLEIRVMYQNRPSLPANLDKECSTPEQEISEKDFELLTKMLVGMGARRRENGSSYWYTTITDTRHHTEYIFRNK